MESVEGTCLQTEQMFERDIRLHKQFDGVFMCGLQTASVQRKSADFRAGHFEPAIYKCLHQLQIQLHFHRHVHRSGEGLAMANLRLLV